MNYGTTFTSDTAKHELTNAAVPDPFKFTPICARSQAVNPFTECIYTAGLLSVAC